MTDELPLLVPTVEKTMIRMADLARSQGLSMGVLPVDTDGGSWRIRERRCRAIIDVAEHAIRCERLMPYNLGALRWRFVVDDDAREVQVACAKGTA